MKIMMTALAAISLAMTAAACSEAEEADTEQTASDGTITGEWLADPASAQFENDTRKFVLADGAFDCQSCIPPYQVTADGTWQTVDRPGMDGMMIETVDDKTVRASYRFGERELGSNTYTVSDDGQTLTVSFVDTSGEAEVTGTETFTRVAEGPAGSHALSGEWSRSGMEISETGLRFSYSVEGDQYSSTANGDSFTATVGGEPVAVGGSTSNVMVAVESTGENSYRETYSRDGETLSTTEITIDGDTMSAVNTDARNGRVLRYTASRQ